MVPWWIGENQIGATFFQIVVIRMVGAMSIQVMGIEEQHIINNNVIASMMVQTEGFVRRQLNVFALISAPEMEYVVVDFARWISSISLDAVFPSQ